MKNHRNKNIDLGERLWGNEPLYKILGKNIKRYVRLNFDKISYFLVQNCL